MAVKPLFEMYENHQTNLESDKIEFTVLLQKGRLYRKPYLFSLRGIVMELILMLGNFHSIHGDGGSLSIINCIEPKIIPNVNQELKGLNLLYERGKRHKY